MKLAALATALALALPLTAQPARAAAPLQLTRTPVIDPGAALSDLACVSEARCVAVDAKGGVIESADAVAGEWGAVSDADGEHALTSVSCTPSDLCVAGDDAGGLLKSTDGGATWDRQQTGESSIASVSCAAVCVAVSSAGELLLSSDPAAPSPTWTPVGIEHVGLRAVSCDASMCAAAGGGYVSASAEPATAHSWSAPLAIDAQLDLAAISCGSGEGCVAVDEHGQVFASQDAARSPATWSSTALAPLGELDAISCAGSGLCLAAGAHGEALASDDAGSATPGWAEYAATGAGRLAGASCLEGGVCFLAGSAGVVIAARTPAPVAATGEAVGVGPGGATLTGRVDAEDALITGCEFRYGTSTSYGASVPCSAVPQASGGESAVSATVGALQPNTGYHYRLLAATARGASAGVDAAFATAPSADVAVVHPHPSINGTAAVGSKLTCQSGIAASSSVHVTYAWLRDQVAIPEANTSSYTVRGADNGAHLQCAVSATDGGGSASATSAFANVPYQSPPAASGESAVGRAYQAGAEIAVPLLCAADAPDGCTIALRATSGPLTLASGSARLAAGRAATVAVALTHAARALLARRRRLSASFSASGTVLGVISARLSSQSVLLRQSTVRARRSSRGLLPARAPRRTPAAHLTANASLAAVGPPSLSPTPYMGWDTYFAFGGDYDEATVLEQASRLITLGLARLGYRYVWLDVGWWQGQREASGRIEVNRRQWPHGMAWLASTLHSAGLKVGLYTDAGANGCGGTREGSYGHYQQDVDTFAAWGFDAVKVDFCGGAEMRLAPGSAYGQIHEAIERDQPHRAMLLDVCDFLQPEQYGEGRPAIGESAFSSYLFGQQVANSWRTDTDVGTPGHVSFADVLRNLDADAAAPQAAGPGHWNDPDYLGPDQGLSAAQFRTQFSMWSELAAPLMISDNLQRISPASLATVRRAAVIAVDQDPAGRQGTLVDSSGSGQVWVKPLAGGARAVALLNRGSAPLRISAGAGALSLAFAGPYRVVDLWSGAVSVTGGDISALVPGQSTVLLRVASG